MASSFLLPNLFAPASIMMTFSLVEAVRSVSKSDTAFCARVGFTMNSPSIIPIRVMGTDRQTGCREMQVAIAEPSIATTSGSHLGSTDITMLFNVTSLR